MAAVLKREEIKQVVDSEIQTLFTDYYPTAATIDPEYEKLLISMLNFIQRGGKRIRAYLTYLGYRGFHAEANEEIYKIAASQELLHNFLLIHDDIIDRDDLRYHGLNISGLYAQRFKKTHSTTEAKHYGLSTALLAGDINHIFMHQLLVDSTFDDRQKIKALRWVGQKTLEVAGGELLDLIVSIEKDHTPSPGQLLNIARYKTASYSFECPLVLGALLAGADESALDELSGFAVPLGIAYQLQDDLIGMFGSTDDTGKPVGSDLREGKQTLLINYSYEAANDQQRRFLQEAFGDPSIDEHRFNDVLDILHSTGAKVKVEERIDSLIAQATAALPQGLDTDVAKALLELSQKTLQRSA